MSAGKWVIEIEKHPGPPPSEHNIIMLWQRPGKVETLSYKLTHVVGAAESIEGEDDGFYHLADLWHELDRVISQIDGWEHF